MRSGIIRRAVLLAAVSLVAFHAGAAAAREPAARVAPLTARIVLNGERLDFGSAGHLSLGGIDGVGRAFVPTLSGTLAYGTKLSEGLNDRLYSREQSGWYIQLRNVDRRRTVTTTRREAIDLMGFKVDLTITGACIFPGHEPGTYCTYTPGVSTDPDSLDPESLLPRRFVFDSEAGDVISKETHDALQEEGFQRSAPDGEEVVGISLDLPNSGFVLSQERARLNTATRYEEAVQRPLLSFSHVRQTLTSNDERAAIARTVRGFVLLDPQEWTAEAAAVQLAAWLLPTARTGLSGGRGAPNLNIGNNLFYAANNVRIPGDSITAYQAGVGYVAHPTRPIRSAAETAPSYYNSFWMGFSPVRDVAASNGVIIRPTGPRLTVGERTFVQGGIGTGMQLPGSGVTIIDDISNRITQIELSAISDLFVQTGLELTAQEALLITRTQEVSEYRYVPHLSFSGNRTDGISVLRYYSGATIADEVNAYLGFDYSRAVNGWTVYAGAEAYSRPNRDYFSSATARLTRAFPLQNGNEIMLGIAGHWELDRPPASADPLSGATRGDVIDLLGRYRTSGGMSFDLRQRFLRTEDGHEARSTTLGVSHRASDRFSWDAQVTPFSDEDAFIRARAGMSWRLAQAPEAPTLRLQWADMRYRINGQENRKLEARGTTFLAAFESRF